jgi:hypothetical protein
MPDPVIHDVAKLMFPELLPPRLELGLQALDRDLCFDTAYDKESGIILLCTRAKNHSRRHHIGNGEIITRVWS